MHELINKLAFSLFKKNSLEECKLEEIEELVKQYPYFSSAQVLLAAKQKQTASEDFQKQLTTASLHVNNLLWLDHLLSSQPEEEKIVEEKLDASEVNNEPNNDELVLEKNRRQFVVASKHEVDIKPTSAENATVTTELPSLSDEGKEEVSESAAPPAPESVVEMQEEAFADPKLPASESVVERPKEIPVNPEAVVERQDEVLAHPEPPKPEPTNPESPATRQVVEKKESESENKLVFEPYYTVDYFASQGIKNVIEEKPKDRFSQQLKSFTEWLKAIRQMPPQQVAALGDSKAEEKVVQLATHSLDEENVDTEAMAEVWIKQGQPEKAIRIYEKLSLLNPPKSSYFASLIENLKKT